MKLKIPSIILLLMSYNLAFASGNVANNEQPIQLNVVAVSIITGQDPATDTDKSNKHRIPGSPIPCIIDENGVIFQMDTTPEIIGYEIYDSESVLIYSVGDEEDFIQTLFSLSGNYTVVFRTQEYAYIGSIEL